MSNASWPLWGACILVCSHLVLYITVIRHLAVFREERGILLYHMASFATLILGAGAACVATASTATVKAAIGALSLHAIYSMSFLEAWSLSQISYSIAILDAIDHTPCLDLEAAIQRFADTGSTKRTSRLSSLHNLGLVVVLNNEVALAPRGCVVAGALSVLRWIANLRNTG